jgi:hypothetical protein
MLIEIVSVPWYGFRHRGISVTFPGGWRCIYANSPGSGVVRQTLQEFALGRRIETSPISSRLSPHEIVRRAESLLGKPYNLLTWNCDHFVRAAVGHEPESQQLQVVCWALIGAFAIARLTKA